jgi:hypothetical protein
MHNILSKLEANVEVWCFDCTVYNTVYIFVTAEIQYRTVVFNNL